MDYFIRMAFGLVTSSVKNPKKKAAVRDAALEAYTAIKEAYPDDPAFD